MSGRAAGGGSARRVALLGLSLALGVLAGYVERALPSPVPAVPGIKLGIANIVPLYLMYRAGWRAALGMNVLRCLLAGLLFTGAWGTLYALSGAAASFVAMAAAKRARVFGVIGVSVAGGAAHNLGQLAVA
ncbi:MAG: Gx transporter family protein, partial [Oscillospiraceae bacterium]|nr:Gx transporter family protein [Oscillospiraceae bacterium]